MKKIVLIAALALVPAFSLTSQATAQEEQYGTEVCVNASLVDEAKRLFPNATLHVLPDRPGFNGWRIVSGYMKADGRIHSDEEEYQIRLREYQRNRGFRAE